jgi:predicted RNA methylase
LGKLAGAQAAGPLAEALGRERIAWVRPSLILALGAVGGDAAREALSGVTPGGEQEREALHKALERVTPRRAHARWSRGGPWTYALLAEAPVGLEEVAAAEARERGVTTLAPLGPGLLQVAAGSAPWELLPALRCIYGLRIEAGRDEPLDPDDPQQCAATVERLAAESPQLAAVREWLSSGEETIRFRFAFERPTSKELLRHMLAGARRGALRHGLIDSPSNYDIELIVDTDDDGSFCFIKPSFHKDTRFAYRERDVPAAINPVVAACLARLVRSTPRGLVFDPTCGSGTLLIERALLDERVELAGLDISADAVAAAQANIAAAGLGGRVTVLRGDARDRRAWPQAHEVLANLPFGLRTRRDTQDVEQLYLEVVANLAARLRPGGRAVLYASNRRAVEYHLGAYRRELRLERAFRVLSGDLWVNAWLLAGRA